MTLEDKINALCNAEKIERSDETLRILADFRGALNCGQVRFAEPQGEFWKTNPWVKKGLFLHVAVGVLRDISPNANSVNFDLDTLPPRYFTLQDRVRVPPGSYVRDGAYLGQGVTCASPVFVDIAAYIGPGTFLDSNVSVGSCTQIGARVQISCGTQIAAVMAPPPERWPTIICDDVLIGGNCGIYGGVYVGKGAVIGAGTILTAETRVYDPIKTRLIRSQPGQPLAIPPGAILMPGAWPITKGSAGGSGLMLQIPIVVGYRDEIKPGQDLLADLTA